MRRKLYNFWLRLTTKKHWIVWCRNWYRFKNRNEAIYFAYKNNTDIHSVTWIEGYGWKHKIEFNHFQVRDVVENSNIGLLEYP